MQEVRWGIIGCGNVTEVKSGPGFQLAEGSRLVAVMRRNAALAEDYAKRHGVPRWYADAEALIRDPEVDAVYIATPPSSHKDYTLAAAAAGKPVYVEKPMARNEAECEEMIEACRKAGVPLFVAYYRRALPRFQKVKELLEAGAIGEPLTVTTTHLQKPNPRDTSADNWRLQPDISGGGYFIDLASHTLNLLDHLLGPIDTASGVSANLSGRYAAEDTVCGAYRFGSGVLGMGTWCFSAHRHEDMNEIVGSKGSIRFSSFRDVPVQLITDDGVQEWSIAHPKHIQQPLIQLMVDELRGIGRCPSDAESAARTSRVMDALLRGVGGSSPKRLRRERMTVVQMNVVLEVWNDAD